MDSLFELLEERKSEKPKELELIKIYLKDKYSQNVKTAINGNTVVITVNSSSLASNIRLNLTELKNELKITKRIQIIIN